ncbi:hypothetical protein [Sphingomonas immobilis]|uniref:Uncharacterized protein n=1 Tax=Sphingomonas immobilis TaxID=3063997 RepID=A0ABT8ZYT5_9SPHN|nr:hypothetical protein [Sphingomonas sp. CA1-15]MDO7842448.1 hypothetical protein [Sphingomonas sp. CA1-15]
MIALAFLAMQAVSGAEAPEVFTCEQLKTESAEPHEPLRKDLVITHLAGGSSDGVWTVAWPGKAPIEAATFKSDFGSIGGSVAFRWTEPTGRVQTAYISFSDIVTADGSRAGWLSLGKPSLWQPPGYMCATPAIKPAKVPA